MSDQTFTPVPLSREYRTAEPLIKRDTRSPYATFTSTNRHEGTRRCYACQVWKPLDAFYRRAEDATCGRARICRACQAEQRRVKPTA